VEHSEGGRIICPKWNLHPQLLDLLIAISKEYAREYQRERAMPPYGRRLGSKMLMHAELRPAKANIQEPLRAPSDAYR
jgi:hypothetical protein